MFTNNKESMKKIENIAAVIFKEKLEEYGLNLMEFKVLLFTKYGHDIPYTTLDGWLCSSRPLVDWQIVVVARFFKMTLEEFNFGTSMKTKDYERLITEQRNRALKAEQELYFLEQEIKSQMPLFGEMSL